MPSLVVFGAVLGARDYISHGPFRHFLFFNGFEKGTLCHCHSLVSDIWPMSSLDLDSTRIECRI